MQLKGESIKEVSTVVLLVPYLHVLYQNCSKNVVTISLPRAAYLACSVRLRITCDCLQIVWDCLKLSIVFCVPCWRYE